MLFIESDEMDTDNDVEESGGDFLFNKEIESDRCEITKNGSISFIKAIPKRSIGF